MEEQQLTDLCAQFKSLFGFPTSHPFNLTVYKPSLYRSLHMAEQRSDLRVRGALRSRQPPQLLPSLLHPARQRVPRPAPDLARPHARRHSPVRSGVRRGVPRLLLLDVQPLLLIQ